jgi:NAD-dependent deacetylase
VTTLPAESERQIQRAADLLKAARFPVALTGAGISTPSGIPDFRSPTSGMWEKYNPMEVASILGFRYQPEAFYEWIRPLAQTLIDAEPNPAHSALAALEAGGHLRAIITQNIDMLHTRAGSRTVYEVHGSIATGTCIQCYKRYPLEIFIDSFLAENQSPTCPADEGLVKPDVVLLGEQLPVQVFNAARNAARQCDLMLVAGSSLEVAPVSEMPIIAHNNQARLIIINFQETYADNFADVVIRDDVAAVLPRLAELTLAAHETP